MAAKGVFRVGLKAKRSDRRLPNGAAEEVPEWFISQQSLSRFAASCPREGSLQSLILRPNPYNRGRLANTGIRSCFKMIHAVARYQSRCLLAADRFSTVCYEVVPSAGNATGNFRGSPRFAERSGRRKKPCTVRRIRGFYPLASV